MTSVLVILLASVETCTRAHTRTVNVSRPKQVPNSDTILLLFC